MNLAISLGLLLGLLVLPVLVSGCLPDGRGGVPWYEARRDPTGAGDAYATAYIVGRNAGLGPAGAAQRATAVVASLLAG